MRRISDTLRKPEFNNVLYNTSIYYQVKKTEGEIDLIRFSTASIKFILYLNSKKEYYAIRSYTIVA